MRISTLPRFIFFAAKKKRRWTSGKTLTLRVALACPGAPQERRAHLYVAARRLVLETPVGALSVCVSAFVIAFSSRESGEGFLVGDLPPQRENRLTCPGPVGRR